MKAIVVTKYSPADVMELSEVEKPAPKDNEVLVKVHASSVNFNNLAHVRWEPSAARAFFGLQKPKLPTPGNDIAGRVEAVGRDVQQFHPGDEVFGDISLCGFGAFAEYVAVPETSLVPKPTSLNFEEAAAVPEAAVVALQGLRKGQIRKGHKVLIYGASGGIGTFAVQIAKSFETEVTGVCSTKNLELVRSLGADHVIDYTTEDFTRSGQQYDLILATAGYHSIFDYKRALRPGGSCIVTGGSMAQIFQGLLLGPWVSMFGTRRLGSLTAQSDQKDLAFVKGLIDAGKVKPVIDRRYTLGEMAEAFRYYGKGHTRGKVVIAIAA